VNRVGWIPWRLRIAPPEPTVDWCWLGSTPLIQPFFDQTLEDAHRRPFNALFAHSTSIADLLTWHRESPGVAPAGFIFHMSRCGSTLISRMLASMPQNLVLSEPAPLDVLARSTAIPEPHHADWLRAMLSALAQPRTGQEIRCFVKFDAATAIALPLIRRVFPDVPWIFVYREPEEVLISHLRTPASAMARGMLTDAQLVHANMPEILEMTDAEYAARAIGYLCECAARGLDERGLLVNYAELPGVAYGAVARHFGLDLSSSEIARMEGIAGYHAKQPRRKFEADGESKRDEVTEEAAAAAARWIRPAYEELERLRLRRQ
jgi:hypothetical protein